MVKTHQRVAVFGGDGRLPSKIREKSCTQNINIYRSCKNSGVKEQRRLEASIKAGSFGLIMILTRWNCHSATKRIRKLCRKRGVKVVMIT